MSGTESNTWLREDALLALFSRGEVMEAALEPVRFRLIEEEIEHLLGGNSSHQLAR